MPWQNGGGTVPEDLAAVSQLHALIVKADSDPVMVAGEPKLMASLFELFRDANSGWNWLSQRPDKIGICIGSLAQES